MKVIQELNTEHDLKGEIYFVEIGEVKYSIYNV